jgi:hypothetical protein
MALLIRATVPQPVMVVVVEGPMPEPAPIGEEVKPANGKRFALEELQAHIGGLIEMSCLPDGSGTMVFNEEGKLLALPINVEATMLYRQAWAHVSPWAAADVLVGDVLLCGPTEID